MTGKSLYRVSAPSSLFDLTVWYQTVYLRYHAHEDVSTLVKEMRPMLFLSDELLKRMKRPLPKSRFTAMGDRIHMLEYTDLSLPTVPYGTPVMTITKDQLAAAFDEGQASGRIQAKTAQHALAVSALALNSGNDAQVRNDVSIFNTLRTNMDVEESVRPKRVERKEVFAVRQNMIHSGAFLVTQPSQATFTAEGNSVQVANKRMKPKQVLYISGLQSRDLASHDMVHEELLSVLKSRFITDVTIEVERHVKQTIPVDVFFTARLAFPDAEERSLAYQYLVEWKLSRQPPLVCHFTEKNARTTMQRAYISVLDILIPRLLQTAKDLPSGDDPIDVTLGIWSDNADAVTASMIFLESEELWESGESEWELALYFIGGEEHLKVAMTSTNYLCDLEQVCDMSWNWDGRRIHISVEININDHHAHGSLSGVHSGGTSIHRGQFTLSNADYFDWVAFHCEVNSTVGFINQQYEELHAFLERRRLARRKAQDGVQLELSADGSLVKEDMRIGSRIWKKVTARPVLAMGNNTVLLNVRNYPPLLHVLVACIKTMLNLFLTFVIDPNTKSRRTFEANLATAKAFTEKGDLTASGQTFRSMNVDFQAQCEPALKRLSPYYGLPRLMVYVQKILYHPKRNSPELALLLFVAGFHCWMLIGCLSAFCGGKAEKEASEKEASEKGDTDEKGAKKRSRQQRPNKLYNGVHLHSQNQYWHSLLVMIEMQLQHPGTRLPCEESGERFLRHHQHMTGLLRSKTLIEQELFHRTLTEFRDAVANRGDRCRSGHMLIRNDISLDPIIVCRCVREHHMQLRKFSSKKWQTVRDIPAFCAFNSLQFYRKLAAYREVALRSYLLPSGHLYFGREKCAPDTSSVATGFVSRSS